MGNTPSEKLDDLLSNFLAQKERLKLDVRELTLKNEEAILAETRRQLVGTLREADEAKIGWTKSQKQLHAIAVAIDRAIQLVIYGNEEQYLLFYEQMHDYEWYVFNALFETMIVRIVEILKAEWQT